ncbi:MAG TPA: YceI family protein [Burkholderiaceae bacterium]|nr:YceI family protein [Burkholderiaceae bacterium]
MAEVSARRPRAWMRQTPMQTRGAALLFPLVLVAACGTVPPPAPADTAALPAPGPAAAVMPLEAARYDIEEQASEIRVLVYRDGPLARFGHNHVIIGRVHGEIRAGNSAAESGFRLEIPVDSFTIDPPAARTEEGAEFAAEVSAAARRATRENMLGKDGLDGALHPLIRVASIALVGPSWNPTVTARVTLHGATRDLRFPAAVFRQGDSLVVVAGFRIRQTDFGIAPFSALNGGLLTRDAIDLRVRLVAQRAH